MITKKIFSNKTIMLLMSTFIIGGALFFTNTTPVQAQSCQATSTIPGLVLGGGEIAYQCGPICGNGGGETCWTNSPPNACSGWGAFNCSTGSIPNCTAGDVEMISVDGGNVNAFANPNSSTAFYCGSGENGIVLFYLCVTGAPGGTSSSGWAVPGGWFPG